MWGADESDKSNHLGNNNRRSSIQNPCFRLITDVKMLIGSNDYKRARQGHYEAKIRENCSKVEGKKSWYSPKPLYDFWGSLSAYL